MASIAAVTSATTSARRGERRDQSSISSGVASGWNWTPQLDPSRNAWLPYRAVRASSTAPSGQPHDDVVVRLRHHDLTRQRAQHRVLGRRGQQFQRDRALLGPVRVPDDHLATQRVCEDLVAQAHAEDRDVDVVGVGDQIGQVDQPRVLGRREGRHRPAQDHQPLADRRDRRDVTVPQGHLREPHAGVLQPPLDRARRAAGVELEDRHTGEPGHGRSLVTAQWRP